MEILDCQVQNYPWGDHSSIPGITGRERSEEPEAELWIGAHPMAPSQLRSSGRSLSDVIADAPEAELGPEIADRFGSLPFLAKILAAASPLSIQAHPNPEQAEVGFDREEQASIERHDPQRSYRDSNHKPEIICAITRFEAKCGFRDPAVSARLFAEIGDERLAPLVAALSVDGPGERIIESAVRWILDNDPAPPVRAVLEAEAEGEFARELRWAHTMHDLYGEDSGVVLALLLNHVVLEPGQALFLGAGNLHSYLLGTGLELMASSDNVIRGGLTGKHVDVTELLSIVDFVPGEPYVQIAEGPVHRFETPIPDFSLTRIVEGSGDGLERVGPELVVVTQGRFRLTSQNESLELESGEAVYVPYSDGAYSLSGTGLAWRCCVGEI